MINRNSNLHQKIFTKSHMTIINILNQKTMTKFIVSYTNGFILLTKEELRFLFHHNMQIIKRIKNLH